MARNRKGEVANESRDKADEQASPEFLLGGNAPVSESDGNTAMRDSAGNTLVPAARPEGNGEPVKPPESKDARFKRLANKRFPRAIKSLKALTNLSNRAQYAYTEQQAELLLAKVFAAVDEMQAKFRGSAVAADNAPLFS